MARFDQLLVELPKQPKTWLITGVAGFIGSNLLETLLKLDQRVVGLDNFSTGYQRNLDEVQTLVSPQQWTNFKFIHGDIRHFDCCQNACVEVDYVLHQAALGSVPRSLADPIATNETNITGFLNMMVAARDAKVRSFIYAASSSTYGDHSALPKVEENIGNPLSPYAVTKYVNELYAGVFARNYSFHSIGLRYFNVFGPRQDPNGAYAAVIPKWTAALLKGEPIFINGDGETSRDFCFVANAVQANILAATAGFPLVASSEELHYTCRPQSLVYNVAFGDRTSLNELFYLLRDSLVQNVIGKEARQSIEAREPNYRQFRDGDVRHSQADISKARLHLGYEPQFNINRGIKAVTLWHMSFTTRDH